MKNTKKESRKCAVVFQSSDLSFQIFSHSLLLQDVNDEIPKFRSSSYVGEISENSPRATPILFLGGVGNTNEEVLPEVFDHDSGTNGTFQLFLEGDQGIFDVCVKFPHQFFLTDSQRAKKKFLLHDFRKSADPKMDANSM